MRTYNYAVIDLEFLYLGGYCDSAIAIKGFKTVKQLVSLSIY